MDRRAGEQGEMGYDYFSGGILRDSMGLSGISGIKWDKAGFKWDKWD